MATTIIMGWNKNKTTFQILFGSVLNNLLNKTERTVIVVKTPSSFREIRRIQLFCPQNAQFEKGFYIWVDSLILLIRKLQVKVGVHCSSMRTLGFLTQYLQNNNVLKYFVLNKEETNDQMEKVIQDSTSDLLIFVHSRKKAVSYNKLFDHAMKSTINKPFTNNMVIIYPEQ